MKNPVYTITKYLVDNFQSNPLVNTVAFETTDKLDANKQNIYPLVNIDIIDSDIQDNVTVVNYTITILEAREYGNKLIDNKIFGTNFVDNISECHLIASKVIKSFNTNTDIFLDNNPKILFINEAFDKMLDGVQFDLTLSVTNETDCE